MGPPAIPESLESIAFIYTAVAIYSCNGPVLHADRADAAKILNGLLDVFLDDAVVFGDADVLACKHGRLECT